jgi:hypothetical protein
MSRRLLAVAIALAATMGATPPRSMHAAAQAPPVDKILADMRKVYADLTAYADTGEVISEYGTGSTDRFTFTTYFNRVPRGFLLDFRKGQDQYVIWGDPDAFHSWWKATSQQYDYPNPNNSGALTGSPRNTLNTAQKIPTLIYAKADLGGDFSRFTSPTAAADEDVNSHRCHRLNGEIYDSYGATGRRSNTRQMTVWIDVESSLIRKVLEEAQALPGQRSRVTWVYDPQANPTIDPAKFRFTPGK